MSRWLALTLLVCLQPLAASAQVWGPAPEPQPEFAPEPEPEYAPPPEQQPATPDEPESDDVALRARMVVGAGVGRLDLEWPASGETRSVQTGAFAAIDLGAGFALGFSRVFSLGTELAYQTSVACEVEEPHTAGATDTLRIRAHRFAALLTAEFRAGIVSITPAAGYGLRSLRPEVHHLQTPTYTLAGPLGRIGLRVALGTRIALRVAPELQWLLVSQELKELGMHSGGLGFGVEFALEVLLVRGLALEATARDAHASLPATEGENSSELGQAAMLRMVWEP
jgi:hypothetical protein